MTSPVDVKVGPMPWHLEYGNAGCNDDEWAVVNENDGSVEGCHPTRADAVSQMQALYAENPEAVPSEPAASLTAAAGDPTGSMVAFLPTMEDQQRLALPGGEAPEDIHLTACYMGDMSMMAPEVRQTMIGEVAAAAAGIAPFVAQPFGVAAFNPGGDDPCLVMIVGGDELAAAQGALGMAGHGQHQPWIPHVTLAYDSEPYLLMGDDTTALIEKPITFDRVRIAFAGEVTDIALGGALNPQAVDEPVDEAAIVAAMPAVGTPFDGVLVVEGVPDGAGRTFAENSITWAPLPLPLKWQPAEEEEHEGSVIVGRIDDIWRDEANPAIVRIAGVFDDAGTNGAEALRLVRGMFLRGVSLSADDIDESDIELIWPQPVPHQASPLEQMYDEAEAMHEAAEQAMEMAPQPDMPIEPAPELDVVEDEAMPDPAAAMVQALDQLEQPAPSETYHAGRIRSATLVAEAAWVEAEIRLTEMAEPAPTQIEVMTAAGGGWMIKIPELWPEDWFDEPAPEDMPPFGALRITASGRITGYLAPPGVVHRAFRSSGRPITAPTRQDYSEFNNKPALVASRDGSVATINAGSITFNCGHPDPYDQRRQNPAWAREVYDNTCSIVARARIWESPRYPGAPIVAGALLHGIDADAIERMMGSALSGDWQGGKLNAALLVPVEGFPTSVASSVRVREGQMVASAVPVLFERRVRDQFDDLARRLKLDPESRLAAIRQRLGM